MGDAHDAAHVLVFLAHFVEDEEEGVFAGKTTKGRAVGGLGLIFLLDADVGGEVNLHLFLSLLTQANCIFVYVLS